MTVSTFDLGALASEECRNSGSTLKEVLADDELPLSLVQMKAIQTRNAKAHLQNETHLLNETENATLEAARNATLEAARSASLEAARNATLDAALHDALALPAPHALQGAQTKLERTFGYFSVSTVTERNNFQAFVCTFSLAFFAFILVLNAVLFCVQTQQQGRRKAQSVSKKMKPVDHLIVNSKQDMSAPEMVKQKLRTYSRAQRNSGASQIKGAGVFKGVKNYLQGSSEERPKNQKNNTTAEKTELKQALPFKVLDPRLVLPLRETWYAVTIEEMFESDGSFEILRITGFPQLRANLIRNSQAEGGVLELFCSGGSPSAKKQLVARASSKVASSPKSDKAEVCRLPPPILLADKNGESLGELRPMANDRFELFHEDKAVLTLAMNDARQLQLTTACGSSLACTSTIAGHLGVCVNAGADTGLAISISLAAVLLAGANELLWNSNEATETATAEERKEGQAPKDVIASEPNLDISRQSSASETDK
jgi:hypothetical protein